MNCELAIVNCELLCSAFRGLYAGADDPAQFVVLLSDGTELGGGQHFTLGDDFEPDSRLVEFFQAHFELVDEIVGAFSSAGFTVMRCR